MSNGCGSVYIQVFRRFFVMLGERLERVWVKVHHSKTGETIVAACDEDLLGRKLNIGNGVLVEVSRAFYGGVLINSDELDRYLKQATIVNLLGDCAVSYAISRGYAVEKAMVKIDGVPHLQLFL